MTLPNVTTTEQPTTIFSDDKFYFTEALTEVSLGDDNSGETTTAPIAINQLQNDDSITSS